jgi:hypothetical protein
MTREERDVPTSFLIEAARSIDLGTLASLTMTGATS